MPEEPPRGESGGFLAALGGLPVVGGRDAVEDDEGAAPATAPGYGSRLYLGVGAILILALAVALGSIFADGGEPAVSQVREPTISEAPSRIAFSGDAQDARDDERYQDAKGAEDQPGKQQAQSPDDGDEEAKKVDERDRNDKDATQPEDTDDVAVTLPASIAASASTASASTASASTASASASATATSPPTASASASASSAVPASAAGTSVASTTASPSSAAAAPAATAPETAEPDAVPRPAAGQTTPGSAGAPAGPRRVVITDGTGPIEGIVGKVRIVRVR